jgi:Sec-independent protein translocase protein TatA
MIDNLKTIIEWWQIPVVAVMFLLLFSGALKIYEMRKKIKRWIRHRKYWRYR